MDNNMYLFTIKHPFTKTPIFITEYKNKVKVNFDTMEFFKMKNNNIVALNFESSIEYFIGKRNRDYPIIWSVELANKLLHGTPKSFYKEAQEPWLWNKLLGRFLSPNTINLIDDYMNAKIDITDGFEKIKVQAKAWGCDLSYDYVKINGDYRS